MDFNFGTARPLSVQEAILFNRLVPSDRAIRLSEDLDQTKLVSSFLISNYSTNPESIFLGVDSRLQASIEIMPGAAPVFTSFQEGRQLYELQWLTAKIASQSAQDLIKIPIMVWDLTRWYIQAGGTGPAFNVTVAAFPLPYL